MTVRRLSVGNAWSVSAVRHSDRRGWFQEWFRHSRLAEETGLDFRPVQANISMSAAGVIRGVHYSVAGTGQAKLVTVMRGSIDDYAVDIRPGSPTFGRWERVRLSADDGDAVLLDPHMGHAFQALEDDTVVSYLVSAEFDPDAEKAITPLCPDLAIRWRAELDRVISDKDLAAPGLAEQRAAGLLPGIYGR